MNLVVMASLLPAILACVDSSLPLAAKRCTLRSMFVLNDSFVLLYFEIRDHNYFVYMLTNNRRTTLYTGVTNNLVERIERHRISSENGERTFTSRYKCFNLVYFEHFGEVEEAIAREKQIKGLSRQKKEALIAAVNPDWSFLDPYSSVD
jgi:putative endonuclease